MFFEEHRLAFDQLPASDTFIALATAGDGVFGDMAILTIL
jgi:hypothetical protein